MMVGWGDIDAARLDGLPIPRIRRRKGPGVHQQLRQPFQASRGEVEHDADRYRQRRWQTAGQDFEGPDPSRRGPNHNDVIAVRRRQTRASGPCISSLLQRRSPLQPTYRRHSCLAIALRTAIVRRHRGRHVEGRCAPLCHTTVAVDLGHRQSGKGESRVRRFPDKEGIVATVHGGAGAEVRGAVSRAATRAGWHSARGPRGCGPRASPSDEPCRSPHKFIAIYDILRLP
jgi:hypothetical protein